MGNHICTLIWVIILSGFIGGTINFSLTYKESDNWMFLIFKSTLLGIGASLLVPLFLETISSDLIKYSEIYESTNYLIIAGFCLLAAIFSKRFIEDLYSRVIKAEKNAKEALSKTEELVESKSEVDDIDEQITKITESASNRNDQFNNEEIKTVIDSIRLSTYSFRTVKGISKELNMPEEKAGKILDYLRKTGFASRRRNNQGNEYWSIRPN